MTEIFFFWQKFDEILSFILQYSVFGSIMTIGGMVGAILSGKIADVVGRRRVCDHNIDIYDFSYPS